MTGVKDKVWFLRGGLFAKYVVSLVGLVVFVLAVSGAVETWIGYRATKSALTDAMSEKAEAAAKRIDQSIYELERQISWVTRSKPDQAGAAQRRLYPAAQPGPGDQPDLPAQQPGPRGPAHDAPDPRDQQEYGFLERPALHRDGRAPRHLLADLFQRHAALHVDRDGAFRLQCRSHRRRGRPALPVGFPRRRPDRQGDLRLCGRSARPGHRQLRQGT